MVSIEPSRGSLCLNMITVLYNNVDLFSGICPVPFIGRDVTILEFGDRWGERETFKMNGVITGGCSGFSGILARQETLISRLSSDYKGFEISQGGFSVFSRPVVEVGNLNFQDSNLAYSLPFSLEMHAYPSGYFSGAYGVLDPKNEFSYSESEGGIMSLVHTVSAKGFNTSASQNNALANAKAWVSSKTGLGSLVLPAFIDYNYQAFCPTTISEQISRISATYEVRESYTTDLMQAGFGILRYTVQSSENSEDGKITITVQGDIAGCSNGTMEQVRQRFASFDAYSAAKTFYFIVSGNTDLNSQFVSRGVSEDPQKLRLSFSFVFDNSLELLTKFEYTTKFNYDITEDLISAEIEGTVSSRSELGGRWEIVKAYANSLDLFSILNASYALYASSVGVSYPLNPYKRSESRSENEFTCEIKLSQTYTNAPIPPNGFLEQDVSIEISPSLRQYSFNPCLDGSGNYVVTDLGYSTRQRASFSIASVAATGSSTEAALASMKGQMVELFNIFLGGVRPNLESQSQTVSDEAFGLAPSLSCSYTSEGPIFTIP